MFISSTYKQSNHNLNLYLAILISALGYFVDVFDIIIFSVLRVKSLAELGLSHAAITNQGLYLINLQLVGMILGGLFWGSLGDKFGRTKTLQFSILMYSVANILNGMVSDISTYYICRFVAGFGLAGELGLGITLVNELSLNMKRGTGATLITICGCLGGIAAGIIGELLYWRYAYYLGGIMGLGLLFLRLELQDSEIFSETSKKKNNSFTNFRKLLIDKSVLWKTFKLILLGAPFWFAIGIMMTLAPELAQASGLDYVVTAAKALLYFNIGNFTGQIVCNWISNCLKSRKQAMALYICFLSIVISLFYFTANHSNSVFYFYYILIGFGCGYWSIFLSFITEIYGTNIRATMTTSIPNFIRGLVIPVSTLLILIKSYLSIFNSVVILYLGLLVIALACLTTFDESFGYELDYVE